MIDFKPIEKERINEYKSYYDYTGGLGCELNFVNGYHVAEAVEAVFADAEERGQRVYFAYMTGRERDLLEALFPGRFVYDREPANQDYIYNTGDLATLAGKKYHAKRNHISKFYRIYGDDVRFETLCAHNLADAMQVMPRSVPLL